MSTAVAVVDREPWEKRPKESGKAFAAFALFRDLGPHRTLRKVAEGMSTSGRNPESAYSLVRRWSSQFDWIERAELYQVMVDRRQMEARMTALQEAEARQAGIGVAVQTAALRRMRGHGEDGDDDFVPPLSIASLSAADVTRMIEVGVRVERMALGQATDLIGKVTSITATDFDRIVSKIVDLALSNIPEERHDIFIAGLGQIAANR